MTVNTVRMGWVRRCLASVVMLLLPAGASAATLTAFASIVPVGTFVSRIGGDRVDVNVMVGPGDSPGTYDPRPRQMAALADSQVFFRVGVPFERVWVPRIVAARPELPMIDLRDGIRLRSMDGGGHGESEAVDGEFMPDPHIWTDPARVKIMAAHIRDTLVRLDPPGAAEYRANYRRFAEELDRLDRDIRTAFAGVPGRRFMVFHPAWGYFADAYGLTQIPIEIHGREPGPASLAKTVARARTIGIKAIFVQPQFSRANAEAVARAVDARVITADLLAADYVANLRRVATALAASLK